MVNIPSTEGESKVSCIKMVYTQDQNKIDLISWIYNRFNFLDNIIDI